MSQPTPRDDEWYLQFIIQLGQAIPCVWPPYPNPYWTTIRAVMRRHRIGEAEATEDLISRTAERCTFATELAGAIVAAIESIRAENPQSESRGGPEPTSDPGPTPESELWGTLSPNEREHWLKWVDFERPHIAEAIARKGVEGRFWEKLRPAYAMAAALAEREGRDPAEVLPPPRPPGFKPPKDPTIRHLIRDTKPGTVEFVEVPRGKGGR